MAFYLLNSLLINRLETIVSLKVWLMCFFIVSIFTPLKCRIFLATEKAFMFHFVIDYMIFCSKSISSFDFTNLHFKLIFHYITFEAAAIIVIIFNGRFSLLNLFIFTNKIIAYVDIFLLRSFIEMCNLLD